MSRSLAAGQAPRVRRSSFQITVHNIRSYLKGPPTLRKMRVKAPGLTVGKSGGYRLIYATAVVDECHHAALLEIYYKGDRQDLEPGDYSRLKAEAAAILGNVIDYSWQACGD